MLVIDRIEGQWAVISMGELYFKLPLSLLPEGIKENDVISLIASKDEAAASIRKEQMKQLTESVFKE
ncbi:MAG: DUF3006 domain-containing protein [Candidatus Saccharibacteria bacterium]